MAARKRTSTKTIKSRHRRRRHHRKKSRPKTVSAVTKLFSSINKSLCTCKHRIAKLFSKLVRITTPSFKSSGYKVLKTQQRESRHPLSFDKENYLPRLISPDKRTIFLDLDETLIHSKPDPPPKKFDFIVRPRIDGEMMNFYVIKRPGVNEFLESISKEYEVVVFTAGLKEYASLVLDRLDKKGSISHRLYRDSCKQFHGKYVKDLSEVGRDLRKTVIVDDNPNAYHFQPENSIPVKPFTGDDSDTELLKLMKFFKGCQRYVDMRDAAKEFVSSKEFVRERYQNH